MRFARCRRQPEQTRTEPIAADAREGKDGKNRAKLKLIAGLLGVGFDALRQRETQRRNRQLFVLASGLDRRHGPDHATLANGCVHRARPGTTREGARRGRGRDRAPDHQLPRRPVPHLRPERGSRQQRHGPRNARQGRDENPTELAGQPGIQATLLDTVGTVYMGLGLYDQAKPLLNAAVTQRRELHEPNPVQLSESLNHLGDVLTLQAAYDEAARNYEEALALQRAQPQNPQARALLAKGQFGLGVVFYQQGRYPEAERLLRTRSPRRRRC